MNSTSAHLIAAVKETDLPSRAQMQVEHQQPPRSLWIALQMQQTIIQHPLTGLIQAQRKSLLTRSRQDLYRSH